MKPQRRETVTERVNPASAYLDTKPALEILRLINREDRKVAPAVGRVLRQVARAVDLAVEALGRGGRLVYLGAGTSGRLGVLDAAECVPTFGSDQVIGVMAGAPEAMFSPTESSEDDPRQALRDLRRIRLGSRDVLVGISASGRTPYTLGGVRYARSIGAKTVGVTSNAGSPLARLASIAIIPVVGPEIIAGSSRMKAGTAQKLVLNMLSSATMIRLGRVLSHWMINVQLKNRKLLKRGIAILSQAAGVSTAVAKRALKASGGNLPAALLMVWMKIPKEKALQLLRDGQNASSLLRAAWPEHTGNPVRARR